MSAPTPHNNAKPGDIAKTVLLPGDPLRAKLLAETYLQDAVCYNQVRGMLGFTGKYQGIPVSVQGSGMGMPSMGIYSHELFHFYGVDTIISIGSAGAIDPSLKIGDIVIAVSSCTTSSYSAQYHLPGSFAPTASFSLACRAAAICEEKGFRYKAGTVLTSDWFYDESQGLPEWQKMGVLAVEMESAALYMEASRAGKQALCLLTISDNPFTGEAVPAEVRQNAFTQMMPTYPNGFTKEVLNRLSQETGRGILCNLPYSGTQVIRDYGEEHLRTGDLIVYTSADSVLQIAAHEEKIPLEELYHICETARKIMQGEHGVGRIIARPFIGSSPDTFTRTANRRDFSLVPPQDTLLDYLMKANLETIGVGKISDIFAGKGISKKIVTHSNNEGMQRTLELCQTDFSGLCFVNLVEFDMLYGHRNDALGYTQALNRFDQQLGELIPMFREDDLLFITADHGCDPSTPSTDHSREYVPLLCFGNPVKQNCNLHTRSSFGDLAATIADYFCIEFPGKFDSFLHDISQEISSI